jgi:class 3 adenylate cyclase
MRKILFQVLVLLFANISIYAQKKGSELIDSLIHELPKAKADTIKVHFMSQISFAYSLINPDSGLIFSNRALDLAKKIKWEKGIGNAYYFRGSNYISLTKLPEALDDYFNAMRYFENLGDSGKLAGTLSNIGVIYGYQKKNDKALEYFLKALEIIRKVKPRSNFEAAHLGNIGICYFEKKDFAKALAYNLQALSILKEINNVEMLPLNLNAIAGIYLEMKDNFNTLNYTKQAMDIATEIGNEAIVASCYAIKGKAVLNIVTQKNQQLLDSLYHGNKELALKDAKANLDSALAKFINGDQVQLASLYTSLIELEEYKGNYQAALNYLKLHKAIDDSLFTADNNDKIMQSAMQYEFDKKEATTKLEQEKKDAIQRNIRNSIATGLAGTLIFLIVVYRQRNKISKARKRSDELLLNILPAEVAEELKDKGSAVPKHFDEVTVLFTDFKGFTQLSEKLTAVELVSEINHCFSAFDHIMQKHQIEKIKTIGDAYMAVGGIPIANKTHAENVVNAALDIQQFMLDYKEKMEAAGKLFFEIRIGVHTGTVVAGIVGVKKFAYDIWGDTVNTASRMESSGEVGKVNISGTTYALVKDKFSCVHRGKVQAKGKGEIDMYFVELQ